MDLLKMLFTDPVGIASLITVGVATLIILYFLYFFIKQSAKKKGDNS